MKLLSTLILCMFVLWTVCAGEAPDKHYSETERKAAETLLSLDGTEQVLNQVIDFTVEQYVQSSAEFEPFRKIIRDFVEKSFGYPAIKDELILITLKHYSLDEINALIAFYRTPIGQKKARTDPLTSAEVSELTKQQLNRNLPAFYDALAEAIRNSQEKK